MVYCGRPSRGCQNCKNRRIKCDETRPTCLNCDKTNRACPGFPEEVDLIFRAETPGVKRKSRKTSTSGNRSDTSTTKAVDELDSYADPHTPDSQKRRRQGSQSSAEDDDSSTPMRRDSQQPGYTSQPDSQSQKLPTIEQRATNFFFKNFVLSPRGTDTTRGYLEVAASMFDHAKEGSPLRLATQAVAVSAMANNPKRKHLTQLAARLYGQALAATQKAIQDPREATSDETLLSILLFALYESITSSDHSLMAWTKHIDGAVAIVKARGVKQFENPQSLSLFRSVRAQMLANAIQQHKPIDDFPGPRGWLSDLPDDDESGAFELLRHSIALPNFFDEAKCLLDREGQEEPIEKVEKLLEQALETQQALRAWESYMPSNWAYTTTSNLVFTIDEDEVENLEAWPGPIHTYQDVNVSSIRNNNRVNQMLCSSIVIDALKWLDPTGYTYDEKYITAINRIQDLVDDICYSVPFHLSNQNLLNEHRTEEYGRNMTEAIGGYTLIWPLHAASNMPSISDIQRRWLRGRMRAIAQHYGLEQDVILNSTDSRQVDIANLFGKTGCTCSSPKNGGERPGSQDSSMSPPQSGYENDSRNKYNRDEKLIIDPELLGLPPHSHQQHSGFTETPVMTPTWTEFVFTL